VATLTIVEHVDVVKKIPSGLLPRHIPLTKDDSVMANAYLVRDAAHAYAAANNGNYPRNPTEPIPDPDGRTLIDFLPGGTYVMNPYTYTANSPTGANAVGVGSIGYVSFRAAPPRGYRITGVGAERGVYIIDLSLDPDDI
jgi:hypothetical protein